MHTTPPLSTKPLSFVMPTVVEKSLADGTPLYVVPRDNEDLVTVSVYFILNRSETPAYSQAAGALAMELITRGTVKRTAAEFDEAIEGLGCSISASCGRNTAQIRGGGLREHLPHIVQLMSECLSEPRFDEQEMETLRGQWISELQINQHDPDWLAAQACNRLWYGSHPNAAVFPGTHQELLDVQREHVVAAYAHRSASKRVVIIAGSVNADEVVALLSTLTANLPAVQSTSTLAQASPHYGTALIATSPDAVQSALRIAIPAIGYDHPDFPALQLVANVLGGYTLARLFSVLREEKGYTYGAYAVPTVGPYAQTLDIITSVGNAYTADTVQVIVDQLRNISTQLIPGDELDYARQQLLGAFARSNETPQQTASMVWTSVYYGLPLDYNERRVQKLQSYRPEDLVLVQQRYFDASRWVVGCSGVPEILTEALANHVSNIELWDALNDMESE